MLKNTALRFLLTACCLLVLMFSIPVSAADSSVYYMYSCFTGRPSGTWGDKNTPVSGTWSLPGDTASVTYNTDKGALTVNGWMQANLTKAISEAGEYVVEMDVTAPEIVDFSDPVTENKEDDTYQFKIGGGGKEVLPVQVLSDGTFNIAGDTSHGLKMAANKQYIFKGVVSLPSGNVTGMVLDKETGNILAQKTKTAASNPTQIEAIRLSWRTGKTQNYIATQNWRFYKTNAGTPDSDFIRPETQEGYYVNTMLPANGAVWGNESSVSGKYKAAGQFDQANQWVKMAKGQYVQADLTTPKLSEPISGKTAGLTAGVYAMEEDFKVELTPGDSGAIKVVTTGAVRGSDKTGRTPELVNIAADTGKITLFAMDVTSPVDTGKTVQSGTWYTAKALINLDAGTCKVVVSERESGGVVAEGSGTINWALVSTVLRSHNTASSSALYTQNFKFYKNGGDTPSPAETIEMRNDKMKTGESYQNAEKEAVFDQGFVAEYTGNTEEKTIGIRLERSDNGQTTEMTFDQSKFDKVEGGASIIFGFVVQEIPASLRDKITAEAYVK